MNIKIKQRRGKAIKVPVLRIKPKYMNYIQW